MDVKKYLVRVHYFRQKNDYDGWNLWYWKNGFESGNQANFDQEENDYRISSFYIESEDPNESIGFLLRQSSLASQWGKKDIDFDRFIPLDSANSENIINVYLKEGSADIGLDESYFDCFSRKNYCSINEAISTIINEAIHEAINNAIPYDFSEPQISDSADNNISIQHLFQPEVELQFETLENEVCIDTTLEVSYSESSSEVLKTEDNEYIHLEINCNDLKKNHSDKEDVIINFHHENESIEFSQSECDSKTSKDLEDQTSESNPEDSDTSEDQYVESESENFEGIDEIMQDSFNRQLSKLNLIKLALKTNINSESVISDAKRILEDSNTIHEENSSTDKEDITFLKYLKFKLNKLFNSDDTNNLFDSTEKTFLGKIFSRSTSNKIQLSDDIFSSTFGKLPSPNKKVFGFFINGSSEGDICNNMVIIFNTSSIAHPFRLPPHVGEWNILMDSDTYTNDVFESFEGNVINVKANSTVLLADTKGIKMFEKRVEQRITTEKKRKEKSFKKKDHRRNMEVVRSIQQNLDIENNSKGMAL